MGPFDCERASGRPLSHSLFSSEAPAESVGQQCRHFFFELSRLLAAMPVSDLHVMRESARRQVVLGGADGTHVSLACRCLVQEPFKMSCWPGSLACVYVASCVSWRSANAEHWRGAIAADANTVESSVLRVEKK